MIVPTVDIETDQAPLGIPAAAAAIQIIMYQKTTTGNTFLPIQYKYS